MPPTLPPQHTAQFQAIAETSFAPNNAAFLGRWSAVKPFDRKEAVRTARASSYDYLHFIQSFERARHAGFNGIANAIREIIIQDAAINSLRPVPTTMEAVEKFTV